jgi:hypothetical protein
MATTLEAAGMARHDAPPLPASALAEPGLLRRASLRWERCGELHAAPAGAYSGSLMTHRWRERDSNRRSPLEPFDLAMTETARGFRRPVRTWRHVKALRRRSILRA